jgi:hypothetical protein
MSGIVEDWDKPRKKKKKKKQISEPRKRLNEYKQHYRDDPQGGWTPEMLKYYEREVKAHEAKVRRRATKKNRQALLATCPDLTPIKRSKQNTKYILATRKKFIEAKKARNESEDSYTIRTERRLEE